MKKLIITALLLIMLAAFAGCSESQPITASPSQTTSDVTVTNADLSVSGNENTTPEVSQTVDSLPQESSSVLVTEAVTSASESAEASTGITEALYNEPQINFSDLE